MFYNRNKPAAQSILPQKVTNIHFDFVQQMTMIINQTKNMSLLSDDLKAKIMFFEIFVIF